MYQLPVEKLDLIRQSRKRVKSILCDIGLDSCKHLLEELKCFDAGDDCFENTEWDDLTDSYYGKRRRKWFYRRESLCCALCWFSTRSWYTFRGHVQRCHEEELDLSSLSACPSCPFISHPDVTTQHSRLFHPPPAVPAAPQTPARSLSTSHVGDKFSCRGCGFHDSLIYVMRKHVLVNHYGSLLNRYYGHRSQAELQRAVVGGAKLSQFFCRLCHMPAETSEHLLYHILSSDKHRELHGHLRPFITEHVNNNKSVRNGVQQRLPNLAPRTVQRVVSLVSKANGPPKAASTGTVLLAAPPSTTALLCSTTPGSRQLILQPQPQASGKGLLLQPQPQASGKGLILQPQPQASGKGLILQPQSQASGKGLLLQPQPQASGKGMLLQPQPQPQVSGKGLLLTGQALAALQTTQTTSTLLKGGPISMLLPAVSQSASKPLPITIRVPQPPPQPPPQPRQVLLPPGVQVIQNKVGGWGSSPRGPLLSSQSVRLVPTGNKVNGMPTYTLETVTMATLPGAVATGPVLVTQNMPTNQTATLTVMGNGTTANQIPGSSRMPGGAESVAEKPRELAVQSQVLKKMDNNQVKCLRCKIVLSEKGVFQHLLHGLRCLFCPLVFYSIRQVMEHTDQEHSLSERNHRDFIRREFSLQTDDQGGLQFPPPDMVTTVPKDLLGCRRLNLLLVTGAKDRLYLRMSEEGVAAVCPSPANSSCPFCSVTPRSSEEYELHLKIKHHIVPTIHAILRSPAFKCVYCLGVYTDRSTSRTISIHVQRCRCAPRAAKEAERLLNPDPNSQTANGAPEQGQGGQGHGGQGQARDGAGADAASGGGTPGNKPPKPGSFDPSVPLLLDPTGLEMRSFEDRKQFLGRYFHLRPYLSRREVETLAGRLWFNRTDVASLFGSKRSKCLRSIQKKRTAVLMGFNMTELRKLQHSLLIPDIQPVKMNV